MKLYVATVLAVADGDIMDYEDRDVASSSRRDLRKAMLRWGDSKWVVREHQVANLPLRQLAAALYNRAFWAEADLRVWDVQVRGRRLFFRLRPRTPR
jgi:hypothetical protein